MGIAVDETGLTGHRPPPPKQAADLTDALHIQEAGGGGTRY